MKSHVQIMRRDIYEALSMKVLNHVYVSPMFNFRSAYHSMSESYYYICFHQKSFLWLISGLSEMPKNILPFFILQIFFMDQ